MSACDCGHAPMEHPPQPGPEHGARCPLYRPECDADAMTWPPVDLSTLDPSTLRLAE